MKCSSCGAELKVDNDKEYAVCEHCGSKYKLNEDLNINIKMDDNMKDIINQGTKISKFIILFFVIVFIGFFVFVFVMKNNFDNKKKNSENEFNEKREKSNEEFFKYSFNLPFEIVTGTKKGVEVKNTLDDIISSNKTNDRKISLVFNGESTSNEEKIIEIKHGLENWENFEVIVNYDDNGYVNEIKVEKID